MQKVNLRTLTSTSKNYLFWCVNEHIDFRVPELKSVASLFKIPFKWVEKPKEDPYLILEMESEKDARQLVSRCMTVRSCYELWGEGSSMEELHKSIKCQPDSLIRPHISKNKSFRIRVEGFNKTLRTEDKLAMMESLSFLPFEGPVDLTNPVTKLNIIEYYGLDNHDVPERPLRVFLGRRVGSGGRDLIARYSLKQRSYIGSTSMDAQLSFIMANMAQLVPGSLVLDPFVGTGSVLVSAAHHGAFVWGSDIDYLTVHARTKPTRVKQTERRADESILANLRQYGLCGQHLDMAVVDFARSAWRRGPLLDAIITDPPYGIRESTARVGKDQSSNDEQTTQQKKLKRRQRQQHERSHQQAVERQDQEMSRHAPCSDVASLNSGKHCNGTSTADSDCQASLERMSRISCKRQDNRRLDGSPHYPSKVAYSLCDVFRDLLNFAAHNLVVGGRLVFWLPVFRDDYRADLVPSHPCLSLEHNSEQVLNAHSSRRLITMVKTRLPQDGEEAQADVKDLTAQFREKFFIASQMSREERIARKCRYPRDKRGQGLTHRLAGRADGGDEGGQRGQGPNGGEESDGKQEAEYIEQMNNEECDVSLEERRKEREEIRNDIEIGSECDAQKSNHINRRNLVQLQSN